MKGQNRADEYVNELKKWVRVGLQPDETLKLTAKNGEVKFFKLEIVKHLANIEIQTFINQIKIPPKYNLLIAAPYIRRAQAEILDKNNIDYFDLAGNVHITAPGFYIHIEGKKVRVKPEIIKGRILQRAGLQIIYILLTQKDAIQWTYRQMADVAGVVHGTVGLLYRELKVQGFILGKGQYKRIARKRTLFNVWLGGYWNILRPKLLINKYRPQVHDQEHNLAKLEKYFIGGKNKFALTGSKAAFYQMKYYQDNKITFFVDNIDKDFLQKLSIMPDPDGTITQLYLFSDKIIGAYHKDVPLAHPLLIYAELIYDGTDRATEAARLVYEKYLKDFDYDN
ncbi:hypothetical protein KKA47_03980 [bacterium]|nr:hypothetical protein [bacterium]